MCPYSCHTQTHSEKQSRVWFWWLSLRVLIIFISKLIFSTSFLIWEKHICKARSSKPTLWALPEERSIRLVVKPCREQPGQVHGGHTGHPLAQPWHPSRGSGAAGGRPKRRSELWDRHLGWTPSPSPAPRVFALRTGQCCWLLKLHKREFYTLANCPPEFWSRERAENKFWLVTFKVTLSITGKLGQLRLIFAENDKTLQRRRK